MNGKKVSSLVDGLKEADILSLSTPLTDETRNLITLKEMKMMAKNQINIIDLSNEKCFYDISFLLLLKQFSNLHAIYMESP